MTAAAALEAPASAATRRPRRTIRGVPIRALAMDVAAVAVLLGVMVWEYATPLDDGTRPPHPLLPLSVAASILAFAPILVRRFAPFMALTISVTSLALPSLIAPVWVLFYTGAVPAVFLLYTVARYRPLRIALGGAALLLAMVALGAVLVKPSIVVANTLFLLTFEVLVVALGVALKRSAEQKARLAELLVAVRAEQADRERLAVLDERAALARDLHDVVAHAVSLMLVQAGAARLAVHDDTVLARQFLLGVEQAGRDASGDLRQMLGVLRSDAAPAGLEPAPGLGGLDALVERMRGAGLDVELVVAGRAPVLAAGLDVAAYRIVQEALTNVLKHAGPTRVRLVIEYSDPIRIAVRDDGPRGVRPAPARSGHGLVGMRERAALFGGRIDAGPVGTGFEIAALLPLPERG